MSQDVVRCYNCGTTRWGSRAKYIGTPDRSQKSLGIQSIFRMYDELLGGFKHCLFSIIWDNHPNWRTHIFQKGLKPPITELDDGNIYRKPLYLMVKNMVSCRFSLKPIHWTNIAQRGCFTTNQNINDECLGLGNLWNINVFSTNQWLGFFQCSSTFGGEKRLSCRTISGSQGIQSDEQLEYQGFHKVVPPR